MADRPVPGFADTRVVIRSAAWNLLGRAGPIVVALLVTPHLLHSLGESRWGIFTIALSLIGIFGIFDLGLGRALTRAVAERIGAGKPEEAASLVLTGMLALTALSVLGAGAAAGLARQWVGGGLRIPPDLHDEVLAAMYVLCLSAPLVVINAAMWGVIAAFQKFRAANLINIPILSLYYLGPLAALQVWDSLVAAMLVLVGCRLAMTGAYWLLCVRAMPSLRTARLDLKGLRPLLRLGGWMTVSNLMSPFLSYADRFAIASVLSAAAAGYYTTPLDLVSRFSILSFAIMSSAYPAMAASFRHDAANTATLFRRSTLAIIAALFPACLVIVALGHPLLAAWLGAGFAGHAAPLLFWISLGVLLSCVGSVAAGLIDGIGRADVNAKLAVLELALFMMVLMSLLSAFGILGAAMAFTVRIAVEIGTRLWFAARLYPPIRPAVRQVIPAILAAAALLGLPLLAGGGAWRVALAALAWAGLMLVVWRASLAAPERAQALAWLRQGAAFARAFPAGLR